MHCPFQGLAVLHTPLLAPHRRAGSVCGKQILHYDIKPENILVRLEDFGKKFVGVLGDVDDVVLSRNCTGGPPQLDIVDRPRFWFQPGPDSLHQMLWCTLPAL